MRGTGPILLGTLGMLGTGLLVPLGTPGIQAPGILVTYHLLWCLVLQYVLLAYRVLDSLVLGADFRPDYFFPRPLPMGNVNPFEAEYFSTIITSLT